jgi:HEAT repeat protein
LRKALGQAQGKCKLNVVQALGTLGDAAAAPALRQAAADQDQAVRVAAAMSLAKIGDAASAELLLKTADAEQGYARAEATDACLRLAERLAGSGQRDAAAKIYRHLASTRTDPTERYLRDAAQAALK